MARLSWALLYVDDVVLIAGSLESVKKFKRWSEGMESVPYGMYASVPVTSVM